MIIPEVLESEIVYTGKIISIRRDKLTRGDGNTFICILRSPADSDAAFCGAQRTPMRFRADAVRSITDALNRLLLWINSWAGSLQYSA